MASSTIVLGVVADLGPVEREGDLVVGEGHGVDELALGRLLRLRRPWSWPAGPSPWPRPTPALAACVLVHLVDARPRCASRAPGSSPTSPERVSDLLVDLADFLAHVLLVAQPEPATPAIRNTGTITASLDLLHGRQLLGRRARAPGDGSGLRHVAAARLDRNALARGGALRLAGTGSARRRVVSPDGTGCLSSRHDARRRPASGPLKSLTTKAAPAGHLGVAGQNDAAPAAAAVRTRPANCSERGSSSGETTEHRVQIGTSRARERAMTSSAFSVAGGVDAVGDHDDRSPALAVAVARSEAAWPSASWSARRAEGLHLGEAPQRSGMVVREPARPRSSGGRTRPARSGRSGPSAQRAGGRQ